MSEQDRLPDRDAPPVGHNQPAFVREAVDLIRESLEPFRDRRAEFLAAAGKVVIRDRHDAGAAADLIGLARDVAARIDEHRKRVGGPHDDAVKAVNNFARGFWDDVVHAMEDVQAKIDEFAEAEKRRVAAQAEEQKRDEERRRHDLVLAGKPVTPPPPASPRQPPRRAYRGDYGRQAIVGEEMLVEIVDVRALPDIVLGAERVREAIVAVVKPMLRNGMTIPGLKISSRTKTSIRR